MSVTWRAQNFTKPSAKFVCQIVSLSSSKRDKPASDYDTVTAQENEDGLLPEPFTSLFDYNAINMEKVLLQEFAIKNSQIMNAVSTKIYLTESQNLQNHRASQMCGDCIE